MSESEPSQNPLIEALPPATDYLTYLTIIEYNLTVENLPALDDVLQDEKLAINIGWDLVHLLLPLLPESQACLQTVARLGNPREVLLKVTESLRVLSSEHYEEDESESQNSGLGVDLGGGSADEQTERDSSGASSTVLVVRQMNTLLSMLSVLHNRLQAKRPSRFLATTLQAVLAAFSRVKIDHEAQVDAIVDFVKAISPQSLKNESEGAPDQDRAADPERESVIHSDNEERLQTKLLQAFITHILEVYILSIESGDDIPALAWSSRASEEKFPDTIVPGRPKNKYRFNHEQSLRLRDAAVTGLVQVADDLALSNEEVKTGLLVSNSPVSAVLEEDEPPESAEDIPLSSTGCLFLIASKETSAILHGRTEQHFIPNVFPFHAQELPKFIGVDEEGGISTAGTEAWPVIDGTLAIGLVALAEERFGEPESDEEFFLYLQRLSLISANTPSPTLRYQAHFIMTSVLRSHPSDVVRLSFIRDTLEHCPYENLKASAVSWIKGETVEANPQTTVEKIGEDVSVFATPVALQTLGPFLFPDLTQSLGSSDTVENWNTFRMNLSFYLAILNFYYLLLLGPHFQDKLRIAALHTDNDVGGSFIGPLRQSITTFRDSLREGILAEAEDEEAIEAAESDFLILEDALERVESQVAKLA